MMVIPDVLAKSVKCSYSLVIWTWTPSLIYSMPTEPGNPRCPQIKKHEITLEKSINNQDNVCVQHTHTMSSHWVALWSIYNGLKHE